MNDRLHLELQGKRVTVIGLGRSGQSALRLLTALGAHVVVADQKPASELAAIMTELTEIPVEVFGDGQYEQALQGSDLVLLSPACRWHWPR